MSGTTNVPAGGGDDLSFGTFPACWEHSRQAGTFRVALGMFPPIRHPKCPPRRPPPQWSMPPSAVQPHTESSDRAWDIDGRGELRGTLVYGGTTKE